MGSEYRQVLLGRDIAKDAILSLFEALPDKYLIDDFRVDVANGEPHVFVRQLDVERFRYDIQRLDDERLRGVGAALLTAIEDIRSYGLRGGKRVFAGYNDERKVKGRKAKMEKRGAHYYANDGEFEKSAADLPSHLENKIICGDAEWALKQLPANCVDLIFTSPPYNFGLEYDAAQDDHHWERYFDKLFAILDEGVRILKHGGRLVINIQPLFSDYIPSHHIISHHLMKRKMIWKGEILWEKNNYNCKYTAWGSWRSPSNPYLKYTWEFLEVFCKGSLKKIGVKPSDLTADEFKKWVVAKWSIAPERNMKELGHPAMFPEELAKRVIKLFSFPGDVVLDPFNGAGTTTAVAQQLERRFVGIDTSEEYCAIARKRLKQDLFLG